MIKTWNPGDLVVVRGIFNNCIWIAQSSLVVKDDEREVALALLPGAECRMPDGYINGKHGPGGKWDRWGDYLNRNPDLQSFTWHTRRLLLLMEPDTYYGTVLFWEESSDQFINYYINFQTPFKRSERGFDFLDLELDIIIEPNFIWHWKDTDEYQSGIQQGVIHDEWVRNIENAKKEVFIKLENRLYPFDGSWLDWKPDPNWSSPALPENWDKI